MSRIYRVRTAITGNSGGSQVATHYFDATSPFAAQDAADAVHAFWDALKSKIVTSYSFQVEGAVDEIDVTTGNPVATNAVTSTVVTGTEGTEKLPPATQGLIEWRTGFYVGGREIRGRTFIPGLSNSSSAANGVPTSTWITLANGAATAIIGWTSSNFVVYSPKKAQQALVIAGTPWNEWAVLRSRRD